MSEHTELLKELNARYEEEELVYDFKVFINYIVNNRIKVSPKDVLMPREHISTIKSFFKNPIRPKEEVIGNIFKFRGEMRDYRFYFLSLLAGASFCIGLDEQGILVEGGEYKNFMQMGGINKKRWLVYSWYFNLDWGYWMWEGNFGRLLQKRKFLMGDYLQSWLDKTGRINFKETCEKLRRGLDLKWEPPSQSHAEKLINWGIEYCLLLPLTYFNIIELVRRKDEFGTEEIVGFYIKPLGTAFLKDIITLLKG